MKDITVERTIN